MLFNGRALIFLFSGIQDRIAEIERLQSLFKMSIVYGYNYVIMKNMLDAIHYDA